MKPLSVEMAGLLGIQNEIQAVCGGFLHSCFLFLKTEKDIYPSLIYPSHPIAKVTKRYKDAQLIRFT